MRPAQSADPAPGRIVVGISGGVDSSVAALLLKQAGYDVQAVFMKNWNEPASDGRCRWEDDVEDALAVCESLDIPINTVDLSTDYWDGVFRNFLDEYAAGRTPNPDILCNREIKFKAFVDYAAHLGSTQIATGHYARSVWRDGAWRLLRGVDAGKDQSYFLYTLGQSHLEATCFPLGELAKPRVRAIARSHQLATHAKKDSTGICFIGEQRFREFLGRYLPARPGEIRTLDETCIGSHGGVFYYTLGQRQGLGIGGVRGAREAPWYVVRKEVADNVLYVAQEHDHPLLMSRQLSARMLSWTRGQAPPAPYRCTARTRYRQADQPCTIRAVDADHCEVEFDQPQWAVTPGQSVVFYAGEECLGGGVITVAR